MADNWLRIRVTKVVDPGSFVGQIGTDETFAQHDMVEQEIAKYCEDVNEPSFDVEDLEALDSRLVLVKSLQHRKWIRGLLLNTDSDSEEVDVMHIDYGTSEIVPVSHIVANVPEEVTEESWPRQGVMCGLADVRPIINNYIQRAINLFRGLVEHTTLDCEVVSSPTDQPVLLRLYVVDDNGEGRFVSDILVSEGVARPFGSTSSSVPPQLGKKEVPQFDLSKLAKRHSSSSASSTAPPTPMTPGDDVEAKELRFRLGGEAYNYESSDKTIGKEYKPNVPIDMIENISSQLNALQQETEEPLEDKTDPEFVEASKKLKKFFKGPKNEDEKRAQSPPRLQTIARQLENSTERSSSCSPGRRAGRGRGSARRELVSSPVHPGGNRKSRDHEDEDLEKKPSYSRKPDINKTETNVDKLTGPQLENEYEWQKYQLERKIESLIVKRREEPVHAIVTELTDFIYPSKSAFNDLPGPSEVYICLHKLIVHAINAPSYMETVLGIIEMIRDYPKFPEDISEILWSLHDEYVVLFAEGSTVSAKNYSKFLGKLYLMSEDWEDDSRDNIFVCVCNILEKWQEALVPNTRDRQSPLDIPVVYAARTTSNEKPRTGSVTDRHMKLYSDSVEVLIKTCGQKLVVALPTEMESLHSVVRRLILSKNVSESLLNLYGILTTLMSEEAGNKMADLVDVEVKGQPEVTEVTERSSQTDWAILEDAEVQTDFEDWRLYEDPDVANCNGYSENEGVASELEEMEDAEQDEYAVVRVMLAQLKMDNMLGTFMENAIRDCTMQLDFADLKELLKECGLKAGAIYEIKSYLAKKSNDDALSIAESQKGSIKSSNASDDGRPHSSVCSESVKLMKSVSTPSVPPEYRNGINGARPVAEKKEVTSKSLAALATEFTNSKEDRFDRQNYDPREDYIHEDSYTDQINGAGDRFRSEKLPHKIDSPTVVNYNAPEPPVTPVGRPASSARVQRSGSEESDPERPVYMQPMLRVTRLSGSRGHPKSPSGTPFIQHGSRCPGSPDESSKYRHRSATPNQANYNDNHPASSRERLPHNGDRREFNRDGSYQNSSDRGSSYSSYHEENGSNNAENRMSKSSNKLAYSEKRGKETKPMENVDWFDVDYARRSGNCTRKDADQSPKSENSKKERVRHSESQSTANSEDVGKAEESPTVRKRYNLQSFHGMVNNWINDSPTQSRESSMSPDVAMSSVSKEGEEVDSKYKVAEKKGRRKKVQLKKMERNSPGKTENVPVDLQKMEEGPQSYAGALLGRDSKTVKADRSAMINGDSSSFDSDANSNDPMPAFAMSQRCTMCGSADHRAMTCPERSERFLLN